MPDIIEDSDSELISGMRKGNVFIFDRIYKKYNYRIYRFSLRCLRNKQDAEEVLQDVFMNLWRIRKELEIRKNLDSYLFTMTLNAIRRHFRNLARERKYQEHVTVTQKNSDDSVGDEVEYENLLAMAEKAINKLPKMQKRVYQMSFNENLSVDEISAALQISKRTVENHLHRAKLSLRKTLKENE